MFKRILSVVLVLSLVISMVPTVFATEHNETSLEELLEALLGSLYEEQEQEPVKLVSLGDSMTNGYGLPGYGTYLPGAMGGTGVEDYANVAYANQFAAWLAGYTGEIGADQVVFEGNKGVVEHTRLAMSGLRAEDLHWLLELDYESEAQLDLTERTKLWSEAQINKYRAEKRDYW